MYFSFFVPEEGLHLLMVWLIQLHVSNRSALHLPYRKLNMLTTPY